MRAHPIIANPVADIERPSFITRKTKIFRPDAERQIVSEELLRTDRDVHAMAHCSRVTALRRSEIANRIRVRDLDFDNHVIVLAYAKNGEPDDELALTIEAEDFFRGHMVARLTESGTQPTGRRLSLPLVL